MPTTKKTRWEIFLSILSHKIKQDIEFLVLFWPYHNNSCTVIRIMGCNFMNFFHQDYFLLWPKTWFNDEPNNYGINIKSKLKNIFKYDFLVEFNLLYSNYTQVFADLKCTGVTWNATQSMWKMILSCLIFWNAPLFMFEFFECPIFPIWFWEIMIATFISMVWLVSNVWISSIVSIR